MATLPTSSSTSLSSGHHNGVATHGAAGSALGSYGGYGGVGYPYPATQSSAMEAPPVDLWGAILRRKFIVILAAIVGAGLGYLHYVKTPEVFRSELKLSVISKTPPKMFNGETLTQQFSLPFHRNLMVSELVLNRAIEKGDLLKTALLRDAPSPIDRLRQSISVQQIDKSDNLMLLSATGPDRSELPKILEYMVEAYSSFVMDDNRSMGQETVELLEVFQQQFVEERDRDELRLLELSRTLAASETDESGKAINPFASQVKKYLEEQNENKQQLQEVVECMAMALDAVKSGDETELRLVASEARRRFGLAFDDSRKNNEATKRMEALSNEINGVDKEIERNRQQVMELNFRKQDLLTAYGTGHSDVKALADRVAYFKSEIKRLEGDRAELVRSLEAMEQAGGLENLDWDARKHETEQEWIKMYLVSLEREKVRLTNRLQVAGEELAKARQEAAKISGDVTEARLLQSRVEDKQHAIRLTLDRLSEMNLLSQNYDSMKVTTLNTPGLGRQVEPVLLKSLGIGTLLLALLGCGLAILIDRADLSFHNPTEIFTRVNVPVVGRLPRLKLAENSSGETIGSPTLVTANVPNSAGAEAFRTIRTHLFFDAVQNATKVIMVTSPSPGDGKSTIACNLAVSIAQTGKRVVLIDADLRRPRVHQHFGISDKIGVMNVLKGESTLKEALHSTFLPNLFLLPCGNRPKNPGEVITSENFVKVLEMLRSSFDFVILDTPPVIPVADPISIATLVDGVYLAFRIRRGVKITASRAKELLAQVNARLLGVIVNGLDENPHYNDYGGYYQYSGYSGYGRVYQDRIEREYKDEPEF